MELELSTDPHEMCTELSVPRNLAVMALTLTEWMLQKLHPEVNYLWWKRHS